MATTGLVPKRPSDAEPIARAPDHGPAALEWTIRVELAAVCRLLAHYGWDDLVFTHVSARLPGPNRHILTNPLGLLLEEMTASSLIKIDPQGKKVVDSRSVNALGFTINVTLHMAHPDANTVICVSSKDGVAVSAQAHGLLPLSQKGMMVLGDLAYHDFQGVTLQPDARVRLVQDLGPHALMILRNCGTLAIGKTCADAFMRIYALERACSMQVRTLAGGTKPNRVDPAVQQKTARQGKGAFNGASSSVAWPALIRMLDRRDSSYRS